MQELCLDFNTMPRENTEKRLASGHKLMSSCSSRTSRRSDLWGGVIRGGWNIDEALGSTGEERIVGG